MDETLAAQEASDALSLACVKCGRHDICVRWHRSIAECDFHWRHTLRYWDEPRGEHLHYICRSCGFQWTGPTKDSVPNPLQERTHEIPPDVPPHP